MFQFNENDLDFGIYKIYNLKRKHIEGFIDGEGVNDLTPTIQNILKEVNLENQKNDALDLHNFLKGINKESLLEEPEKNYDRIKGQLELDLEDENEKSKLIDTLNNLKNSEGIADDLKDKIYNHILGFFQMYYSNGDFGYNDRSRDLYKVPYEADYNGSDTMFHWKHKGSLYIKTGTSFNAIKFELNGKKIEYRLETNENSEEEGTSQNNNKDSQLKHYRFDRIEKVKDPATKETIYQVIFYLSDTSTSKVDIYKAIYKEVFNIADIDKYLEYENIKKDGSIEIKGIFNDLTKDFDKVSNGQIKGLSALREKKKTVGDRAKKNFISGQTKSGNNQYQKLFDEETKDFTDATLKALYTLDQKLNSFYIGNDADYFIHENLNEFLTNEKNRYVKNYIFDDLESIYSGKLDNTTLLIAKAFDKVSTRIIEFLNAIEDFQKHLFTKKKKVVESEYCITVDYIDEKYYAEILANKTQLQEWENLFSLDVKTIEDLKANPTLVLDTKCFKQVNGTNPFKDKILAEIDDLDDKTNGLLINSENYQVLNLMLTKYKNQIDMIYIDPPYNTGGDAFAYKDNFRHSSWTSFLENRIKLSKKLFNKNGLFFGSIDDNEIIQFRNILNDNYGSSSLGAQISIQSNKRGQTYQDIAKTHEYLLTYNVGENSEYIELPKEFTAKSPSDKIGYFELWELRNRNPKFGRHNRPNLYYPIYVNIESLDENGYAEVSLKNDSQFTFKVLPKNSKGKDSCWRWDRKKLQTELDNNGILSVLGKKKKDGNWNVYEKARKLTKKSKTIWFETNVINEQGTVAVNKLGIENFGFPKPVGLLEKIIKISCRENSTILDFFAGSGTTAHAAIIRNKDTDIEGLVKYILIEMGNYFKDVTKPRIQKIVYSENWSEGKPLDKNGSPKHIFKYQVIEQYEDVLDNLQVYKGALPKNLPIKYLYKPEENSLDTTLNLFTPFNNTISYGQPTQQAFIDITETYNYLQGYFLKSIKTYESNKKYYKVVETTNGVLVIWRDIAINEDDSNQIIEIASKYSNIHTLEVNAEFATLNLDKSNHLKVDDTDIELKIISKDIFNQ